MRWGTLERVPQTPQNFSKTGLRSPGIGTFRAFLCLFLRGDMVGGGWFPVTKGGACLLGCSLTLPLACFPAPIPLTPFPAGRGGLLLYFAGGFAPGTPAAEPIGLRKPGKKRSLRVIPPPQGHLYGRGIQCRTRSNAGDARGEAPCIRKLKPPFPPGRGTGG